MRLCPSPPSVLDAKWLYAAEEVVPRYLSGKGGLGVSEDRYTELCRGAMGMQTEDDEPSELVRGWEQQAFYLCIGSWCCSSISIAATAVRKTPSSACASRKQDADETGASKRGHPGTEQCALHGARQSLAGPLDRHRAVGAARRAVRPRGSSRTVQWPAEESASQTPHWWHAKRAEEPEPASVALPALWPLTNASKIPHVGADTQLMRPFVCPFVPSSRRTRPQCAELLASNVTACVCQRTEAPRSLFLTQAAKKVVCLPTHPRGSTVLLALGRAIDYLTVRGAVSRIRLPAIAFRQPATIISTTSGLVHLCDAHPRKPFCHSSAILSI